MTGIGESSYRRDPENMTLNLENLVVVQVKSYGLLIQKHLKEVYLNFPKLKVMGILLENTGLKNLQQRLEN